MAYEMHGEKLHRTVQCAVNLCRNRDTFVFYRGRDFGLNPMHICRDCLRDILREYIRMTVLLRRGSCWGMWFRR